MAAIALFGACSTEAPEALIIDAPSVVLVRSTANGSSFEAQNLPVRLEPIDEGELIAWALSSSLDELRLAPGRLVLDPRGVNLERPSSLYSLAPSGRWTPLDQLPSDLRGTRVRRGVGCVPFRIERQELAIVDHVRSFARHPDGSILVGSAGPRISRILGASDEPVYDGSEGSCVRQEEAQAISTRPGRVCLVTNFGRILVLDGRYEKVSELRSCRQSLKSVAMSSSGPFEVFALTTAGQLLHWTETATTWRALDRKGDSTPDCQINGAVSWLGPNEALAVWGEPTASWIRGGDVTRVPIADFETCDQAITGLDDRRLIMMSHRASRGLTTSLYAFGRDGTTEVMQSDLAFAGRIIHAVPDRVLVSDSNGGLAELLPDELGGELCVTHGVRENDIDTFLEVDDRVLISGRASGSDSRNSVAWLSLR